MASGPMRNAIILSAVVILLAAFVMFPALDLDASAAFYVPGQGFPWRTSPVGGFVRHDVPPLILMSVLVCVGVWLAGLWRGRTWWGLTTRKITYLLVTLIIGPGVLVESLLKPYSGRARPQDLTVFGGTADYTSPLWSAHACTANCSFVSGHAAVAFWITAYAFIAPPPWRTRWLVIGLATGSLIGAMRVMQGAHFPSDIAYAAALVVGVNVVLARMLLGPDEKGEPYGAPP